MNNADKSIYLPETDGWDDAANEHPRIRLLHRFLNILAVLFMIGCIGSVLYYFFVFLPVHRFNKLTFNESPEEIRDICHSVLRIPIVDHHDVFLCLIQYGDETSVPKLIRAYKPGGICSSDHCLEAIRTITNQEGLTTELQLVSWYEKNKYKSRIEWILDGFVNMGYSISQNETIENATILFEIDGNRENPNHRRKNAILLLNVYSIDIITKTICGIKDGGSINEKLGIIHFMENNTVINKSEILNKLSKDRDRSVRRDSLNEIAKTSISTFTNPTGFIIQEFAIEHSIRVGVVSEDNILYLGKNDYNILTGENLSISNRDEPESGIGLYGDFLYYIKNGLNCINRKNNSIVWTTSFDYDFIYKKPIIDNKYIYVNDNIYSYVFSKSDGKKINDLSGNILGIHGEFVFVAKDNFVNVFQSSDLCSLCSIDIGREIIGVASGKNVAVFVTTDAVQNQSPRDVGSSWIEGWSLQTKSRVWGPLLINVKGVDEDGCILQSGDEVCYISQDGIVFAVKIENGEILWESAPDGQIISVQDYIVLVNKNREGLIVMNKSDGRILARYIPNNNPGYYDNLFVVKDKLIAIDMNYIAHVINLPDINK